MTATGHAVVGTVIAVAIPNPIIGIPLAVLSHIAADLFPHWDIGTNRDKKPHDRFVVEAVGDVIFSYLISILLVLTLFPQTDITYALVMVFAAQFLDWASAPFVFFKIKKPIFFNLVYRFQKTFDNRLDKPWGIIGQVSVLIVLILLATRI